jgi:transcriptional regulator with XRE-family HTH domain
MRAGERKDSCGGLVAAAHVARKPIIPMRIQIRAHFVGSNLPPGSRGDFQHSLGRNGTYPADPVPHAGLDRAYPLRRFLDPDPLHPRSQLHADTIRIVLSKSQARADTRRRFRKTDTEGIVVGMRWYDRVKKLLAERNDQDRERLRERLGVAESTMRSYLNGTREPDLAKLIVIADFFDVSMDVLTGRTRYATPPLPNAVQEPEIVYHRYRVLREYFDGLTTSQQDAILRELSETKQANEALVAEYLAKRGGR